MADRLDASQDDPIATLARELGVEPQHRDGFGASVRVDRDTTLALLRSLGTGVETEADARQALQRRREQAASQWVSPVSVHWTNSPPRLPLGPGVPDGTPFQLELQDESGTTVLAQVEGRTARGTIPLPKGLASGYYQARITTKDGQADTLLMVAPPRTFAWPTGPEAGSQVPDGASLSGASARSGGTPRPGEWGTFIPLHALHSRRTPGVGSLSELRDLLDWTGDLGGATVGVLPLMAAYLEEPFDPSPYAPASRLFWNELYLDPEALPEWERSEEARSLANSRAFVTRRRWLRSKPTVDYRGVYQMQRAVLDALSRSWEADGGMGSPDLRAFLARTSDPGRYAAFRAALESRSEPWTQWPRQWREEGIPEDAYEETAYRRHLYAQLRFSQAMEAFRSEPPNPGRGLYLDLPLGAHSLSYDRWANPGLFAAGASLGAPPDGFYPQGQDWGLPPLRPLVGRERGHSHFRLVLETILPYAQTLRIDHVMGLHRLYWIPDGMEASQGAYVRTPAPELYAILSIESHRHQTVLAGEDLGTVPPEVREAMDRHGLRRMYIVPFEIRQPSSTRDESASHEMNPIPNGAVAGVGSHDTPPWSRLWKERSDLRAAFSDRSSPPSSPWSEEGNPWAYEGLVQALEALAQSPAGLVMINLEDLWLEEEPQNRPGTMDPSNWRRRARLSLEELRVDPRVLGLLKQVDRTCKSTEAPLSPAPPVAPDPGEECPND